MSDIALRWSAFDLLLMALLAGSPGIAAGAALGAAACRTQRLRGAAFGALIGFALALSLLWICFSTPIAQADGLAGSTRMVLALCWPGAALGAMLAAWLFGGRRIAAALCGSAIGAVAWLGGWAAFN